MKATEALALSRGVSKYLSHELLQRVMARWGVGISAAEKRIRDLKRFLFLVAVTRKPIAPPTQDVDNAWHIFLNLKAEYERFCQLLGRRVEVRPLGSYTMLPGDEDWKRVRRAKDAARKHFGPDFARKWPPVPKTRQATSFHLVYVLQNFQ
jgi:hypothetical protein